MRNALGHISLLMLLALSLISCDRTPRGVLRMNEMADLIADLQVADAYMESHLDDFPNDSTKLVLKQSIFKKHGITRQDYDSSLVWYAHNMEDYIKAHDKALGKLQERHDKLTKDISKQHPPRPEADEASADALDKKRGAGIPHPQIAKIGAKGDTADLWQGERRYMLTQGARHGFIPFDVVPDADKQSGDRYQLVYKLTRAGNNFKVSLNVDYTDGSTAQIARGTSNDGWVTVFLQSDTARQVRRVYGYVSYDIQHGGMAYVDSLMLLRTHFNKSNYSFIGSQRLLDRKKQ